MPKFTKELVDSLAEKLLIGLSDEENKLIIDEFAIIDENISKVAKIKDIEKVPVMTHCLDDFTFELRIDASTPSVPIEDLLKNCDSYEGREVEVPKVVGE